MRGIKGLKIGDICFITKKGGHGFQIGDRVRVDDLYYSNANCFGFDKQFHQYIMYSQLRKQPVLNNLTKTI